VKIITVIGARPQFVKAGLVSRALRGAGHQEVLVHTGQHYDHQMSQVFFEDLGIPTPDVNLGVGSASHARQTAQMLTSIESVLEEHKPDAVLVYGDTNSTLAAALAATKLDLPVVHLEAGERIYRRHLVPEETNRILTDHIAWLCLTSTRRAEQYLLREGMSPDRVSFVGDPMYDLFTWARANGLHTTRARTTYECEGLEPGGFHLATIHRAENTDDPDHLIALLRTMDDASKPVVLPVHPRVRNLLSGRDFRPEKSLRLIDPVGYFEMVNLLTGCDKCVTDSGGVTRESFFAGKLCIIPMDNTWWVDVAEAGWAVMTGRDCEALRRALEEVTPPSDAPRDLFGDGNSTAKIVAEIGSSLAAPGREGPWHSHGSIYDLPPSPRRETPFTHATYRALLREILGRDYRFSAFPEAERLLAEGQPFMLMRHDIDFSIEAALAMAEIEAEVSVQATYFFMLRTDHYNILSREGTDRVRRILDLGHHLGLHFDCEAYGPNFAGERLRDACAQECAILESWFGRPVEVISFHRPSEQIHSGDAAVVTPRLHTYMPLFTRRIHYLSDSGGHWRFDTPTASRTFEQGAPFHVLIHPIWWQQQAQSAFDTLMGYVDSRKRALEISAASNCKSFRSAWLRRLVEA
jgi:UDP-GlcNAc3NAcA epimerase